MADRELKIKMSADVSDATRNVSGFGDVLKTALAVAIGQFVVPAIKGMVDQLGSFVRLAAQEQVGIMRLGAAVSATGADWQIAGEAVEEYIRSQQARVTLDDGDAREALGRLTTATGDYQRAMELLPITLDLARAKEMDLVTASELVGKVAAGNTSSLSRYGIVLKEGATATEALAELQQRFAGQAEAYTNTLTGQQERLSIAFGDLKEVIGGALLPVLTEMATWLADLAIEYLPDVERMADAVALSIGRFVASIRGLFSGGFDDALKRFLEANRERLADWGIEIDAVWRAWDSLRTWVETAASTIGSAISGALEAVWEWLQGAWQTVSGAVTGGLKDALAWVNENWADIGPAITGALREASDWITETWVGVTTDVTNALQYAQDWVELNWPPFRDDVTEALQGVLDWLALNWIDVSADISAELQYAIDWVALNWAIFETEVTGTLQYIIDWVALNWAGISTALSAELQYAIDWVALNWGIFTSDATAVLQDVLDWVDTTWPLVSAGIDGALETALTWVETTWPAFRDNVQARLQEAKDWVETNWPAIGATMQEALEGAKDWVETNWPLFRDAVQGRLQEAKDWIGLAWPAVQSSIQGVLEGTKAWVDLNWPLVRDAIEDNLAGAKKWVEDNWPLVRAALTDGLQAVKDWVDLNLPKVRDAITTALQAVKTWIETNWPGFRDDFIATCQEIKDWVDESWPKIRDTVVTAIQEIKDRSAPLLADIKTTFITENTEMETWTTEHWPLMRQTVEQELGLMLLAVKMTFGLVTMTTTEESGKTHSIWLSLWNHLNAYAELQGVGPAGLRARVATVLHLINGEWKAAWDDFKSYVEITWDAIKLILNVDEIITAIQRLIDLLNNAKARTGGGGGGGGGSGGGGGEGGSGGIPNCGTGWHAEFIAGDWVCIANPTGYASGTRYYPGGFGLVGESGPELVTLPRGSQITPAGATANALSGATWNVTINTLQPGAHVISEMRYLQALAASA